MGSLIKKLLTTNKEYSKEDIKFTIYCLAKMQDRGIGEDLVVETLTLNNELYYAERQEVLLYDKRETRYKLIYKVSSRYSLIIIVAYEGKILKVINVIKTSKSAEKLWRKKISK